MTRLLAYWIKYLDTGCECTISKFADDPRPGVAFNSLEG